MKEENRKLKGIVRNQIKEIKTLRDQINKLKEAKGGSSGSSEDIALLQDKLNAQNQKFQKLLNSKEDLLKAAKKDLKSSQREIEGHLNRHAHELLELHNQLINERMSRDHLLTNLTEELISSLRSETKSSKPQTKSKPVQETSLEKIDQVLVPKFIEDKADTKKTIFYAAPQIPNYDQASGGKRAFLMLKLLAKHFNVICYGPAMFKDEHGAALEDLGIRVIRTLKSSQLVEKIKQVDAFIISWFNAYYLIEDFIPYFPRAKVILDTVDVHWLREERSLGNWDGITEDLQQENKLKEIEVYEKADIIWTVTQEDRNAVLAEIPEADVRVVSNIHTMKPDSYIHDKPDNILFFGGYKHYPNINAVKILAKEIFPKIRQLNKKAKLLIAGSNAPREVLELADLEGVEVLGFINFDDVADLYANSKLTIVPLTEGAGIKGKICEAIEYRVPVITNDIGNEGILLKNRKEGFITNDFDKMADYAIQVLSNSFKLDEITQAAQAKLEDLVGPEANLKIMHESIIPTVDICIVSFNKKELLEKCINSILENTEYPHFNIIVYSNGCTDGTPEYLNELAKQNNKVSPILADTNNVFVLPNNEMMLSNIDHDVVLLNNDVIVTKAWLSELVKEAYKSRTIGIVGSKILYPDNRLQEFGSELYMNGSGRNIGKNEDPNEEAYMRPKKAAYVSGCSMYIKRSTIAKIGVFDELFHPCYAEDSDYCYTAWENGIEVNVTPASIVYHLEGASSGTDTNSGFKKFQKINIQKFLGKHASTVEQINQRIHSINTDYISFNDD